MPQLDFLTIFPIVLGILLLCVGRRVFWLFVGASIFLLLLTVIPQYVRHQESLIFYIALGAGVVAAIAGYFLQKIALRVAGFVAGGFLFYLVWSSYPSSESLPWWLPFVVGGILGAVLLSFLLEWALIVLSSLLGAYMITYALQVQDSFRMALLIVLTLAGVLIQFKSRPSKPKSRS